MLILENEGLFLEPPAGKAFGIESNLIKHEKPGQSRFFPLNQKKFSFRLYRSLRLFETRLYA